MMKIKKFTFNPFQENTYVLSDESKECIIFDPGCFNVTEQEELSDYIKQENLRPVRLICTHAHIDHVLGNHFVAGAFNLGVEIFRSEYDMLALAERSAEVYGIPYTPSPEPSSYIADGELIQFGNSSLKAIHVPGHAPDHLIFVNEEENILIGGDVLFKGSIGRTDLPGGNHHQLIDNIENIVFKLKEELVVYSGHGPETTVGEEKRTNPFFQ